MARDPAGEMKSRIRSDLAGAMRGKRAAEIAALRTLIGAIDNAQAPPAGDRHDQYRVARFGDASVEVQRKKLTKGELDQLITNEIEIRLAAAKTLLGAGANDKAQILIREAELLGHYLR